MEIREDIRRQLAQLMNRARQSNTLVATKRRIGRHVVGDDRWRIIDGLPLFRPGSHGDVQSLAALTVLAAQQTIHRWRSSSSTTVVTS